MILYLSGPMSGVANCNFPAFHEAAKQLREAGYEVVNPAELCDEPGLPWTDYMRIDISYLIQCEGIALLPGHENSKGARLELRIATDLDMPAKSLDAWLSEVT